MSIPVKPLFYLLSVYLTLCTLQADEFYRDNTKEVVIDQQRHLMWQDNSVSIDKSLKEAKAYCDDLDLAGYRDWYLPSVDELKSIIKAENYPRCIDNAFENVNADYYWSSTEYSKEYGWIVLFIYEDVSYYHKSDTNYVRCVRRIK